MKWPRVLPSIPLELDASSTFYPRIKSGCPNNSTVHIHIPERKEALYSKCLDQEHNSMTSDRLEPRSLQPRTQGPPSSLRQCSGCGWSRVYACQLKLHSGWVFNCIFQHYNSVLSREGKLYRLQVVLLSACCTDIILKVKQDICLRFSLNSSSSMKPFTTRVLSQGRERTLVTRLRLLNLESNAPIIRPPQLLLACELDEHQIELSAQTWMRFSKFAYIVLRQQLRHEVITLTFIFRRRRLQELVTK